MPIYAILKNGLVENTVIFDKYRLNELAVIFPAPEYVGIETTEENAPAGVSVGDEIFEGKFRRIKPFDSWTFNSESWQWEAPSPYPRNGQPHVWDEDSLSWIAITD